MTDPTAQPVAAPRAVDRYCDDLLVALRVRDVPGPRIGEVLTEVRAHLADSGESPVAAFGAPEDYAAALTADRPPTPARERVHEGLVAAAFAVGGSWLADGAMSLADGEPTALGPGTLLVALLAALGGPWALTQLVSSSRARVARGFLAVIGTLAALVAVDQLLDDRFALGVPAAVTAALGLLALGAGTLALRGSADPVVDPFVPPAVADARRRRDERLVTAALWGWLLLLVAVAVGAAVLADRLS
ncbi:hypothetical protein [Modestobacter sp. SYSU DS0290]